MQHENTAQFTSTRLPFGTWLASQVKRDDAIGALARAAHMDRGFPLTGDVQAVSKRLNQLQADGEMHVALEEAELDWLAL
ncbi:MAG: hypothetical protein U5M50_08785 [Sphingobium sp.]|nr:hypothetical protein [Sphingobium sp.]